MASEPVHLGSIEDDQGVEVGVYREADGSVALWAPDIGWHERFEPAERDKLAGYLQRAAMPGQVPPATCDRCEGGLVPVGHCNCGSPADASVNYAHERLCGWEPCPNGCWDKLHPEAPSAGHVAAEAIAAPANCGACWHLWTLHDEAGCHASNLLDGEYCHCEHSGPGLNPPNGEPR